MEDLKLCRATVNDTETRRYLKMMKNADLYDEIQNTLPMNNKLGCHPLPPYLDQESDLVEDEEQRAEVQPDLIHGRE